jgi:drug/metabolite transporter (DMT)-like permease
MSSQLVVFETLFALFYGFLWSRRPPNDLEIAAMGLFLLSVVLSARAHSRAHASTGPVPLIEGADA